MSGSMYSELKKHLPYLVLALFLTVICLGLVYQIIASSVYGNPMVRTPLGVVKGVRASDGDYNMFMGIPFAEVNASNPFGKSQPYPHFETIFSAYDDTSQCPQIEESSNVLVGTLECLKLNIYVPRSANFANRMPVFVYILGGRNEVGSGGRFLYSPKFLVGHNIIVVTFNYRLGPYGFQCLGIPEVSGNQGIKDQILALRWVKENIASFGGDNNKITIGGEGSGGQSVDFIVKYCKEDLFARAIIGAGARLDHDAVQPTDPSVALRLSKDLGLNTNDLNEALFFLSKKDTNLVIAASNKLDIQYKPCIESEFENIDALITKFPLTSDIENIRKIPLMITQSSDEDPGVYAHEDLDNPKYQNIFKDKLLQYFEIDDALIDKAADYVRQFYIGINEVGEAVRPQIIDFCLDLSQNYPTKLMLTQYLRASDKIYYSVFSYAGKRNFRNIHHAVDLDIEGRVNVDEIGYIFDVSYMAEEITSDDQLMINRMTMLWTNFVKYGNPTPVTTNLLPIMWEPVTNNTLKYLKIDLNLSMETAPFEERMAFWEQFQNLLKISKEQDTTIQDSFLMNLASFLNNTSLWNGG